MTQPAPEREPDPLIDRVRSGYSFTGPALELGALMRDATTLTDVPVRIPLGMLNRHGLVAGATGTGKTKTLQLLAEQLSAQGVPVFAADIKGDLSGLSTPGATGDKITARAASVGQTWTATGFPVELLALGGQGTGLPLRATMSSFGPTLLAKVLGLNETQESSLGLVFHYADRAGLPLLDLADLRAVVQHLTSAEGKGDLKDLGGLSSATAGVILRELIGFADQGADAFFGEPEFDTKDLLRTAVDGRGVISLVELPNLQDRPAVFSTFLMWLLADLFHDLPEVGDADKPALVFFFDEAHLLFRDASKDFLSAITQTVRLIRSKGVGVFFVTQSPTDVPDDVLAQLGSRVQHQLRAHTPNDAKALKATVNTYPTSGYDDLGAVLTTLGIGEAVITVMDERGAPTPVAWTRLRAPESLMAPGDAATLQAAVAASSLHDKYAVTVDRESAREMLARRLEEGAAKAEAEAEAGTGPATSGDKASYPAPAKKPASKKAPSKKSQDSMVTEVLKSQAAKEFMRTAAREITRGVFGIGPALSDREEIETLKYAYLRTLDLKRWTEFESLMVPDVTGTYGELTFESRDELVGYMRRMLTDDLVTLHQVHHPEISVDGDVAHARWYLHDKVFVPAFDLALEGAAFYDDDLVRTPEGWRFSRVGYHRTFEATWTMSAVPGFALRRGTAYDQA